MSSRRRGWQRRWTEDVHRADGMLREAGEIYAKAHRGS